MVNDIMAANIVCIIKELNKIILPIGMKSAAILLDTTDIKDPTGVICNFRIYKCNCVQFISSGNNGDNYTNCLSPRRSHLGLPCYERFLLHLACLVLLPSRYVDLGCKRLFLD